MKIEQNRYVDINRYLFYREEHEAPHAWGSVKQLRGNVYLDVTLNKSFLGVQGPTCVGQRLEGAIFKMITTIGFGNPIQTQMGAPAGGWPPEANELSEYIKWK